MHNEAKKIAECIKAKINELGMEGIEKNGFLGELGQWTDIVKDMVEYDYYKRIIDAMDEAEEMDELESKLYGGRMGYRGRDSRGRFVHRPGRGRSAGMGYEPPYYHMMPEDGMYDEFTGMPPEVYRMGYPMDGMRIGERKDWKAHSRHGEAYDKWKEQRRYYTQTKDAASKQKMDESMKEHINDFSASVREMWNDADPQLRQSMKADLTKMVQQLQ